MTAPDFLDTNILVYAYDTTDRRKQGVARDLLRRALSGEAMISVQVLSEFASTLLQKVTPLVEPAEVLRLLDALGPIHTVVPDGPMVSRAVEVKSTYKVHFYDAMILAAAERGGCRKVWSEDLNSGQIYFGIVVENPFL